MNVVVLFSLCWGSTSSGWQCQRCVCRHLAYNKLLHCIITNPNLFQSVHTHTLVFFHVEGSWHLWKKKNLVWIVSRQFLDTHIVFPCCMEVFWLLNGHTKCNVWERISFMIFSGSSKSYHLDFQTIYSSQEMDRPNSHSGTCVGYVVPMGPSGHSHCGVCHRVGVVAAWRHLQWVWMCLYLFVSHMARHSLPKKEIVQLFCACTFLGLTSS